MTMEYFRTSNRTIYFVRPLARQIVAIRPDHPHAGDLALTFVEGTQVVISFETADEARRVRDALMMAALESGATDRKPTPPPKREPTHDEILASIRRIIGVDDPVGAAARAGAQPPAPSDIDQRFDGRSDDPASDRVVDTDACAPYQVYSSRYEASGSSTFRLYPVAFQTIEAASEQAREIMKENKGNILEPGYVYAWITDREGSGYFANGEKIPL